MLDCIATIQKEDIDRAYFEVAKADFEAAFGKMLDAARPITSLREVGTANEK